LRWHIPPVLVAARCRGSERLLGR